MDCDTFTKRDWTVNKMEDTFWIEAEDCTQLYIKKWHTVSEPKAILQISHGMAEHIMRYEVFAHLFNENGFIVYGHDHRGHGQTGVKQGLLGYLAKSDGFHKAAEDLIAVSNLAKQDHPDLPLFLFGHSMGSFLTRYALLEHSKLYDGIILAGTGSFSKIEVSAGKAISRLLNPNQPSPFLNKLVFGSYNKKTPNPKTEFDWLSRDEQEVEKYLDDPLCGFIPTARFFYDLFSGLEMISDNKRMKSIQANLPFLLISGTADPVGSYGKGVMKTAHQFKDAGIKQVKVVLLEDARHEILNELDKESTQQIILEWLNKRLENPSLK